jgi:hypothetical protein
MCLSSKSKLFHQYSITNLLELALSISGMNISPWREKFITVHMELEMIRKKFYFWSNNDSLLL